MPEYLLRSGPGKRVMLMSRCAEEVYCQAELVLLLQNPSIPPGATVIGLYEVDPGYSLQEFLKSYKDTGRENLIEQAVQDVRQNGFLFEEVGVLSLVPGASQQTIDEEVSERVSSLQKTVEHYLPPLVTAIRKLMREPAGKGQRVLHVHQDAFAAGYHRDEYILLGMAVKYAGLNGVSISITGKNHETF